MKSTDDVNVVVMRRRGETYMFIFEDRYANAIYRTIGRFASNPDLSLTWYDASVLSERISGMMRQDDRPATDRHGWQRIDRSV